MKILDIDFKESEKEFIACQEQFNAIGEEALYMSHYELAERAGDSPIIWKQFVTEPRVAAIINEELSLIKQSKVAKMLSTVDIDKSVGKAQLLNTLLNQTKKDDKKEGPVFIYTQIPLNEQERGAANVKPFEDDTN